MQRGTFGRNKSQVSLSECKCYFLTLKLAISFQELFHTFQDPSDCPVITRSDLEVHRISASRLRVAAWMAITFRSTIQIGLFPVPRMDVENLNILTWEPKFDYRTRCAHRFEWRMKNEEWRNPWKCFSWTESVLFERGRLETAHKGSATWKAVIYWKVIYRWIRLDLLIRNL